MVLTVGEEIGRGGMGTVFRASLDGLPVAIKVLGTERKQTSVERAFRAEVRAMATLNHPNILHVLDLGTVSSLNFPASVKRGTPYMVMEVADKTLEAECGKHEWTQVRGWLEQLLLALGHAHARGITHRDLKPSNVLLSAGQIKIGDFGLARAFESVSGGDHEDPAGTVGYMPPEQRQGRWRDVGPWTDLYALGRVALDLITRPEGASCLIPKGLDRWVSRLRQEDPRDRYQRAADALHGLRSLPEHASERLRDLLGGVGPGVSTTCALTQPYFEDEDGLSERLPEPLEVSPPLSRAVIPLQESPLQRGAGLLGLATAVPPHNECATQQLWKNFLKACDGDSRVVAVTGGTRVSRNAAAMWLCHQVHETGLGSVDLVTHDRFAGPRHGLSGMVARELRALDLSQPRAFARIHQWLEARLDNPREWQVNGISALAAPALGVGERQPVVLHRGMRFHLASQFVSIESEGRTPLIWLDQLHFGQESQDWVRWMHGRRGALFLITVEDASRLQWIEDAEGVVVELNTQGDQVDNASLVHQSEADPSLLRLISRSPTARSLREVITQELSFLSDPHIQQLSVAAVFDAVESKRWRNACRKARVGFDEQLAEGLFERGLAVPTGISGVGDWHFVHPQIRRELLGQVSDRAGYFKAAALTYGGDPEQVVRKADLFLRSGEQQLAFACLRDAVPSLLLTDDRDRLGAVRSAFRRITDPSARHWVSALDWVLGDETWPAVIPKIASDYVVFSVFRSATDRQDQARRCRIVQRFADVREWEDPSIRGLFRWLQGLFEADQGRLKSAESLLSSALTEAPAPYRGFVLVGYAWVLHKQGQPIHELMCEISDLGLPVLFSDLGKIPSDITRRLRDILGHRIL